MRPAVKWYGDRMEDKLIANDGKHDWNDTDLDYLYNRLLQEVVELRDAIRDYQTWRSSIASSTAVIEIVREAADVGNFAMMIATKVAANSSNRGREVAG